jgi:hypothetical protein
MLLAQGVEKLILKVLALAHLFRLKLDSDGMIARENRCNRLSLRQFYVIDISSFSCALLFPIHDV